jgi:hypothetical protein
MKFASPTTARFACRVLLPLALLAAALHAAGLQSEAPSPSTGLKPVSGPQYNDQGELKRPTGYRTWVFVGANLGLQYRQDGSPEPSRPRDGAAAAKVGNFHNAYINPEAYEHYAKTGKFPDKTVLVMDVYKAEARDAKDIVAAGLFPGEQLGVEVAVKSGARPDGSKTDWAYYDFPAGRATAKAFADGACYDCHRRHADDDNVWVQFYPTLRPHNKARGK